MASIDERVVAMSFENAQFEQRAAQTITTLGKLNTAIKGMDNAKGLENIETSGNKVTLKGPMAALDKLRSKLGKSGEGAAQGLGEIDRAGNKVTLEGPGRAADKVQQKLDHLGAGSTFTDIEKASNQVELSGITKAISNVSNQFSVLQGAASVALGGITATAVQKGAGFAKSFAFGPISQGLDEYKTNLGSIQTILANTQGQQVTGLDNVNKYLGELNTYSDKTIYNFSQMAQNIGTFTAAGVDLPKATESIKGIANLAALSGSSSDQASHAMYQLSQAIASGKVGLQDWNSVVNSGMGGAVFQKALMRTADNMGALEKGAVKIDKATGKATVNGESFRESIMAKPGQQSWLTSDVLTETLSQLTGDMTDAELSAKGFTAEQIKAIQAQAKSAQAAATEVKTLPQVFDVARETIGSGWAKTFQLIFGDFNESKKTFTELSNFINNFINKVSGARNKMLTDWKELGGRDELITGLKKAFQNLMAIIKPVGDAFRAIFPKTSGDDLEAMTRRFGRLMDALAPSQDLIDHIRRIFAGLFAVMHIGWSIVKGLAGVILDLFSSAGKGSGGFLELIADLGDWLHVIDKALTQGDLLNKFFDGLKTVLHAPLEMITKLSDAIMGLFGGGGQQSLVQRNKELLEFGKVLTPAERLVNKLKDAWEKLVDGFDRAKTALEPWFSSFVDKIQGVGQVIGDALSKLNFDDVMKGINTGLFAGLVLLLKNAFGKGGGLIDEISKTLGTVQNMLGGVTGNLEAMQKKVQAQIILAIATAVLALAAGILVLSTIDGDKLAKAMTAVAVGLGELMGSMRLMMGGMGKLAALQLPLIAAGLIELSIAVTILAGAMKIFATMSWEDIAKGMVGFAGSLGIIAGVMALMPPGPSMIAQATGLLILSAALNAIGSAVKIMASMKWEDLGKGLFGIAEVLGFIALAMSQMPPNMIVNAAGILILSFALIALTGAVKAMGSLDLGTLIKGLTGISVALVAIGVAMWLMPPDMVLIGAGLVLVGAGLIAVSKAVEILGNVGIWGLIKGIAALALILIELSVGMYLMVGTLPGAVAMLAAAAAIAVLAPAIALLGNLNITTILKGILAIALALGTIAVVGLVAAPGLAALGIALIPLGLGFMLVAGAAKIFASAMALLSESGQKGIAAFLVALTGFIAILPTIVISFIKGLLTIVDEVTKLAPKVVVALGKILETVIQFITDNAAKLATAIGLLVDGLVVVLVENVPKLVDAGIKLLKGLLDGISRNITMLTNKASEIIVKFMDALRGNMPKLVDSGAKLLRSFLDGISSKFSELGATVDNMIRQFALAVADHAARMIVIGGEMMLQFIEGVAKLIPLLIEKGKDFILNFVKGIADNINAVVKEGGKIIVKFIEGIGSNMTKIANKGADAVITFLNEMATTIRTKGPELRAAGYNVADALLDGIWQGIDDLGGKIVDKLGKLVRLLPAAAKKLLGIHSPSSVFQEIGAHTMDGFAKGIDDSKPRVKKKVEGVGKSSMDGMAKGIEDNQKIVSDSAVNASLEMISRVANSLGIHSPSEVFRDIGMNVNRGFKDGLLGSRDDVISAFDSMNSALIDKIRDLRSQVADGNTKLEDLQKQHADKLAEIAKMRTEKKPDKDEIADAVKESEDLEKQIHEETKAVNQNRTALTAARDVRYTLNKALKDEKKELLGLKTEYDAISKSLEDASSELERVTQVAADAQKKWTDQYTQKPDIDNLVSDALADADLTFAERQEKLQKEKEERDKRAKINQVELYKQALQEQIIATAKYQQTLQALRELGLDDETYQKLLDKGLEGQEFADQLLRSGKKGVDDINRLNAELLAKSANLAKQAADNLYAAGIAAAQGLVDGLAARKAELDAAMVALADTMVNTIKNKLKIKSPSRIFAEIGKFTAQGLARGIANTTSEVTGAASSMGDEAAAALRGSLSHILDTVGNEVDPTLTITPVLDMTQIRKDAAGISDLSNVIPITAATSYGQASATSQEVSTTQQAAADAAAAAAVPSVSFEQNNYSPEALSDVEIYRKTKNQIGQLKSALGVPA